MTQKLEDSIFFSPLWLIDGQQHGENTRDQTCRDVVAEYVHKIFRPETRFTWMYVLQIYHLLLASESFTSVSISYLNYANPPEQMQMFSGLLDESR